MNLPTRALSVARLARSLAIAGGNREAAAAFAQSQNWLDAGRIASHLKAATPSMGTSPGVTGAVGLDLVEVLRPLSIVGRLPGTRRSGFNKRLFGMSAGIAGAWVGRGGSIPVTGTSLASAGDTQRRAVGAITVVTNEVLRGSDPILERTLTADVFAACTEALDRAFVDASNTGDDDTPASVTSSGFSTASTGSSLAQVDADLALLIEALLDTGSSLAAAAWVLHPRTAAYLSRLRGSGGALAHPAITVLGGTLLGLPTLVSAAVPMSDSPETTSISLIDGDGVLILDEDEVELDVSHAGTLEMDTVPTGDAGAPTAQSKHQVSMFQSGCSAIRVVRYVNWLPRRSTVAATLTGVAY